MTGEVLLHPVSEADLEAVEEMFADPELIGEFNWTGWTNPRRWRRRWQHDGLLDGEHNVLIVSEAGQRTGFVAWRAIGTGRPFNGWDIGISLLPSARGRGVGTRAQRLLARYLFEHTPANRVQALTETGNRAEQRALEKAGFTREGTLRGTIFRAGAWRDEVVYSVLRAEFRVD